MSVNFYRPHVMLLPEDGANQQIANGFKLVQEVQHRNIQVLQPAGGWTAVRDSFQGKHNRDMQTFTCRFMILLIDFDDSHDDSTKVQSRLGAVTQFVDSSIRERVFVLGARSEPERLKQELGSYEKIGKLLAKDCVEGTRATWEHRLLAHNAPQLDQMLPHIRPILFK